MVELPYSSVTPKKRLLQPTQVPRRRICGYWFWEWHIVREYETQRCQESIQHD